MNNWKIILACAVIFGAGMVSGALISKRSHPQPPAITRPPPVEPSPHSAPTNAAPVAVTAPPAAPAHLPEMLSKQFVQRMNRELQLKPEQYEAIQKIMGESQTHIRKVMQETRQEILKTLTPEQVKTFEDMGRGGRKNLSNSIRPDRRAVPTVETNPCVTNPPRQ